MLCAPGVSIKIMVGIKAEAKTADVAAAEQIYATRFQPKEHTNKRKLQPLGPRCEKRSEK